MEPNDWPRPVLAAVFGAENVQCKGATIRSFREGVDQRSIRLDQDLMVDVVIVLRGLKITEAGF